MVWVEPSPPTATDHAAGCRTRACPRPLLAWHLPWTSLAGSREVARRTPSSGTLISHACPVHLLVDGMLEAPDRALLIPLLRLATRAPARLVPACPAAVLVAAITPPADPEHRSALLAPPASQLRLTRLDRAHPDPPLDTRLSLVRSCPRLQGAFAPTRKAQTYQKPRRLVLAEASFLLPSLHDRPPARLRRG